MDAFAEEFERRKVEKLHSMLEPETEYVINDSPSVNYKKLFVFSVLFNLFLLFAVREYWSILGTEEYAIYNLRHNSNLSMHKDYLKRVRRVYCP